MLLLPDTGTVDSVTRALPVLRLTGSVDVKPVLMSATDATAELGVVRLAPAMVIVLYPEVATVNGDGVVNLTE
jgi:hypothetical protein